MRRLYSRNKDIVTFLLSYFFRSPGRPAARSGSAAQRSPPPAPRQRQRPPIEYRKAARVSPCGFVVSACCLVSLMLCCRLVRLPAVRHLSTLRMHDLAVHVDICPIMGLLAAILFMQPTHSNRAMAPFASPTRHGRKQQGLPVSGTVAAVNLDGGRCRVLALQAFSSAVYTG